MRWRRFLILLILNFSLVACGYDWNDSGGSGGSSSGSTSSRVTPSAAPQPVMIERLSVADYNAMSAEDKYALANKIMGTLFKGMTPEEFFDLQNGLSSPTPLDNRNIVSRIEADLLVGIDEPMYRKHTINKYLFDQWMKPVQYQLALLYEVPISRNYFELWMAYQLTNTILFSPAVELPTVSYDDGQKVFERLVTMIRQGRSIGEIVYAHMTSQENWRRFRSPEDNTREMMEIYLRRFNDAEVPLAAKACQNWSLDYQRINGKKEYILVIDSEANTESVDILETTIVDCQDFYSAVSNHADLIPTIVAKIVDLFFGDNPSVNKQQIVDDIVQDNPQTFTAIFTNLLFSREYLVTVERPKSFEELFFSSADKIDWYASTKFFKYLNRPSKWTGNYSLNNMKQAAMTYKLGRPVDIPLDTLSFAYYHKVVREKLMIDYKYDPSKAADGGWQESLTSVNLTGDEFIDYLFMAVLSRKATAAELSTLNTVFANRGYTQNDRHKRYQAMIVLDYLSRLSELYYTQPFE